MSDRITIASLMSYALYLTNDALRSELAPYLRGIAIGDFTMHVRRILSPSLSILMLLYGVANAAAEAPNFRPRFTGVNLAGAEFQGSRIPGVIHKDYVYPEESDIEYFISKGMNTFRLPFRWERVQLNLQWDLEPDELARIDKVINQVTKRNAYIILDLHNYARYFGKIVGSKEVPAAALAVFWAKIAELYKGNDKVIFGIMNEPHGLPALEWKNVAEVALKAIRSTGAQNIVLLPGTAWTGAHSWAAVRGGSSNASAFADFPDSYGDVIFEVHQYLDKDFSGTTDQCQDEEIGAAKLSGFTAWLRANNRRGFLGEFGAGTSETCMKALDRMLAHIAENSDVWSGWTYWASGRWWGPYPFSVQPSPEGDKPQMKVLLEHISPQ